ncbi:MAG: hypothetical protein L3J32_12790 [Rhizobiaceae bacterium]|nr:hypothetical protein [Rhizobiaceae bacterium]
MTGFLTGSKNYYRSAKTLAAHLSKQARAQDSPRLGPLFESAAPGSFPARKFGHRRWEDGRGEWGWGQTYFVGETNPRMFMGGYYYGYLPRRIRMSLPNNKTECNQIYREASDAKGDLEYSESVLPNLRNELSTEITINMRKILENGSQESFSVPAVEIQNLRTKIQFHESRISSLKIKISNLFQQSRTIGCPSFP